jgi:hypothetical protein
MSNAYQIFPNSYSFKEVEFVWFVLKVCQMLIKCFQVPTTIKEDYLFSFVLKLCQMLNQVFSNFLLLLRKIVRLIALFP